MEVDQRSNTLISRCIFFSPWRYTNAIRSSFITRATWWVVVVVVVGVVEGLAVDIGGKGEVERIKRLPTAVGVCLLAKAKVHAKVESR